MNLEMTENNKKLNDCTIEDLTAAFKGCKNYDFPTAVLLALHKSSAVKIFKSYIHEKKLRLNE